jgi:hypothetical protein
VRLEYHWGKRNLERELELVQILERALAVGEVLMDETRASLEGLVQGACGEQPPHQMRPEVLLKVLELAYKA